MNIKTKIYYTFKMITFSARFYSNLFSKIPFLKTTDDSKDIYDMYDDREQREWKNGKWVCIHKGMLQTLSGKQIRNEYLKYIITEIDKAILYYKKVNIAEVGCGNCINLVLLKQRYGDAITLTGIDISYNRLKTAKKYFGNQLDGVTLIDSPITKRTKLKNDSFEIVFSMHCLEQIAYESKPALQEMFRLSNRTIVMIEPIFENGNPVQRLYLILSDHNRILKRTIEDLGYKASFSTIDTQSNPLNQSSIIIINK